MQLSTHSRFSCSSETTVLFFDEQAEEEAKAKRAAKKGGGRQGPLTPPNLEAARRNLQSSKSASEDEPYVYLPPGSSMNEPGYNSMSDPTDKRIYHIDPKPNEATSK